MAETQPETLGSAIAGLVGIDASHCLSLTLRITANGICEVEAQMYIDNSKSAEVTTIMKRFRAVDAEAPVG